MRGRDFRFDPDHNGILRVRDHPEVQRSLRQRATRVLWKARADSPIRTGDYKASWHMEKIPSGGWRIYNTDWKAWFIEKGTSPHTVNGGFHEGTMARYVAWIALGAAKD